MTVLDDIRKAIARRDALRAELATLEAGLDEVRRVLNGEDPGQAVPPENVHRGEDPIHAYVRQQQSPGPAPVPAREDPPAAPRRSVTFKGITAEFDPPATAEAPPLRAKSQRRCARCLALFTPVGPSDFKCPACVGKRGPKPRPRDPELETVWAGRKTDKSLTGDAARLGQTLSGEGKVHL
jgi:DNA-directed RNA polymerase subunit RPC12/RpoP